MPATAPSSAATPPSVTAPSLAVPPSSLPPPAPSLVPRSAGPRPDRSAPAPAITTVKSRNPRHTLASVAVIEKDDFASGTSSKSSKLVHGGLRYLEHAQFRLVFEGTNERALLMKLCPHLVRPLEFMVPCYKRDKPGLFVLDVGLWIYDALSKFSSPKLHRTVRAPRVHKLEPLLKRD